MKLIFIELKKSLLTECIDFIMISMFFAFIYYLMISKKIQIQKIPKLYLVLD